MTWSDSLRGEQLLDLPERGLGDGQRISTSRDGSKAAWITHQRWKGQDEQDADGDHPRRGRVDNVVLVRFKPFHDSVPVSVVRCLYHQHACQTRTVDEGKGSGAEPPGPRSSPIDGQRDQTPRHDGADYPPYPILPLYTPTSRLAPVVRASEMPQFSSCVARFTAFVAGPANEAHGRVECSSVYVFPPCCAAGANEVAEAERNADEARRRGGRRRCN